MTNSEKFEQFKSQYYALMKNEPEAHKLNYDIGWNHTDGTIIFNDTEFPKLISAELWEKIEALRKNIFKKE